MALTCLLRLWSWVKLCYLSLMHPYSAGNIPEQILSIWFISPFLDDGLETIKITGHELICLAEAELDWVVASVKWVVKGGLVWTQIHQQVPRPLILHQQPLPGYKVGQLGSKTPRATKHLKSRPCSPGLPSWVFFSSHSPQVHNVAMITQTEGGLGALGLPERHQIMRITADRFCFNGLLDGNEVLHFVKIKSLSM